MKKNLIYIFILLSVMACLDDKSNYDYKDLNDFENWDRNGVSNVDSDYTLYPCLLYTSRPLYRKLTER